MMSPRRLSKLSDRQVCDSSDPLDGVASRGPVRSARYPNAPEVAEAGAPETTTPNRQESQSVLTALACMLARQAAHAWFLDGYGSKPVAEGGPPFPSGRKDGSALPRSRRPKDGAGSQDTRAAHEPTSGIPPTRKAGG